MGDGTQTLRERIRGLLPRESGFRRGLRELHRARRRAVARLKEPLVRLATWLVPRSFLADKRYFPLWQRRGIHALRVHYYSPVPDTRELDEATWAARSELPGIDLREPAQLELLAKLEASYPGEFAALPQERTEDPTEFSLANSSFGAVDAEVLYGLLRELRPRRMIEIGSGHSTLLATKALRENAERGDPCHFTAVEPYPDAKLRRALDAGLGGLSRVLEQRVQDVPLAEFEALGENDVLFIDSSHALRIGSDVQFEFNEVLPRLAPGVVVHVHDIFLPFEYPRTWFEDNTLFFNEQYLLQAFLAFNERFEVMWGSHFMERCHTERLRQAFPAFATGKWSSAGSFWMRRTG